MAIFRVKMGKVVAPYLIRGVELEHHEMPQRQHKTITKTEEHHTDCNRISRQLATAVNNTVNS